MSLNILAHIAYGDSARVSVVLLSTSPALLNLLLPSCSQSTEPNRGAAGKRKTRKHHIIQNLEVVKNQKITFQTISVIDNYRNFHI